MRERSAADNFSLRAFPALLAIAERSDSDKLAARALPPSFPRATALGFFLALMSPILHDVKLDVKGEMEKIARLSRFIASAVSPTMRRAWDSATRSGHISPDERTEGDRRHDLSFAPSPN